MARKRGDGPKSERFELFIGQGLEPIEAAKAAGYTRPERVVKKRKAWAAEALALPAPKELTDAELAKRTLRSIAELSLLDGAKVQASKALIENAPPAAAEGGNGVCVIFSGREGTDIRGAVDPHDVAEAVHHLADVKQRGQEAALEAFAQAHAVNVADLAQAHWCWMIPSVRAATLRALDKHDPTIRSAAS